MNAPLVLVVEDEIHIAEIELTYLNQAGFRTHHIAFGNEVTQFVHENSPNTIVLDLMLPGLDGNAICQELRAFSNVPIIMVTARVEEIDRLLGFENGADDYLCKPFSPRELVVRVKALLRRSPIANIDINMHQTSLPLRIDAEQQRIYWNGHRLDLTHQQFRLFSTLAGSPGRIFSRSKLIELAYDESADIYDRAIDSQMKNLRKRLAAEVPGLELIHSVYGAGYRFEIEPVET